eukprot:106830-Pelagomonas_calceolata.AAC.1
MQSHLGQHLGLSAGMLPHAFECSHAVSPWPALGPVPGSGLQSQRLIGWTQGLLAHQRPYRTAEGKIHGWCGTSIQAMSRHMFQNVSMRQQPYQTASSDYEREILKFHSCIIEVQMH